MRGFDQQTAANAFAHPGNDTRQWGSYGVVEADTQGQRSVTFDPQYGPLVAVRLQPSGLPVICRVGGFFAGQGEAAWYPFVAGDEVYVEIPEGDEHAGCVITARLNQSLDTWPTSVAGNDATTNTFGFWRMRAPFVIETASSFLIRSAATGAFLGITAAGAVTIGSSDKQFVTLGPDFLGLQNTDGTCLIQIDENAKQAIVEASGTKMVFDAQLSSLYTKGQLQIGTAGAQADGHAVSLESLVNILANVLTQLNPYMYSPMPAPAVLNLALTAASVPGTGSIALYLPAITAGLAVSKVPGSFPGIGCSSLLIG